MKLDYRIIEGKKYLDCFDTDIAKKFIGKKGYFADNNYAFLNIKSDDYTVYYATLTRVDEFEQIAFYDNFNGKHYYFLPEEWIVNNIKRKKYRPYTIYEWNKEYHLGDIITMRPKINHSIVDHKVFIEYSDNSALVYLGYMNYTLEELLEEYEVFKNGEWKPFGIEIDLDYEIEPLFEIEE